MERNNNWIFGASYSRHDDKIFLLVGIGPFFIRVVWKEKVKPASPTKEREEE